MVVSAIALILLVFGTFIPGIKATPYLAANYEDTHSQNVSVCVEFFKVDNGCIYIGLWNSH